jgi:Glycosyltransferase
LGYRDSIIKLVEELNIDNNIKFIDSISEEELKNLYEKTYCFISPSFYEGFGMPIIEAMYFGCNVACSNIDVFREIATEHAEFFNPDNIDEIKEALHISRQKENNNSEQIQYVENLFYWDAIAASFLHEIRS